MKHHDVEAGRIQIGCSEIRSRRLFSGYAYAAPLSFVAGQLPACPVILKQAQIIRLWTSPEQHRLLVVVTPQIEEEYIAVSQDQVLYSPHSGGRGRSGVEKISADQDCADIFFPRIAAEPPE